MRDRGVSTQARLDEVLVALPDVVGIAHHGRQRLVVSTGGIFVLDPKVGDHETTADPAGRLAVATRNRLAENLRWVPYVDWFVVTDCDERTTSQIPADLVSTTVLEGHCVDEETVRRVRALLQLGQLTPPWVPGLPAQPMGQPAPGQDREPTAELETPAS